VGSPRGNDRSDFHLAVAKYKTASPDRQVNDKKILSKVRAKRAKEAAQTVQKRSVTIAGHRTSVSLEPAFWAGLKEIAEAEAIPLAALISTVDRTRTANLSSALRVFVLDWVRSRPSTPYTLENPPL
jgi:predicted DNA-binding ribbon-helix-helix protein